MIYLTELFILILHVLMMKYCGLEACIFNKVYLLNQWIEHGLTGQVNKQLFNTGLLKCKKVLFYKLNCGSSILFGGLTVKPLNL